MAIILEGCDGAGKSVLSKYLSLQFGWSVMHSDKMDFWEEHRLISIRPGNMIYDRLAHLSEQVYGPVLRGEADPKIVKHRRIFDRMLLSRSGVVILCEPCLETTSKGWQKNLDSKGPENWDSFAKIYFGYKKLKTDLPVIRYDWENDSREALLQKILKTTPPFHRGPGVGSWKPGEVFLLVGDKTKLEEQRNIPFSSNKGCSAWLAEMLENSGISERDLYWTNAHTWEGSEIYPSYISELQPKGIFALGNNASKYLKKHGFEHEKVPHPQYWKRFHHNKPYPLTSKILEAV